jgi:hypothetical protein
VTSFGSFLRQLVRDVWSQKLRTFLTVFGIIWGTVAVALLLAVGEGVHREQTKSFAGLGDRIVIAWPSRTSLPFEGLGKGRRIRMDESDIEFLEKRVAGLAAISSEYERNLRARFGDRTRLVDVSGVSPVFGEMRNMVPAPGGRCTTWSPTSRPSTTSTLSPSDRPRVTATFSGSASGPAPGTSTKVSAPSSEKITSRSGISTMPVLERITTSALAE